MNLTILIVEDHDAVRNLLQQWLEAMFLDTVFIGVKTGEEALDLLQTVRPHVMLVDIGLPGMNGIELTRRTKVLYPQVFILIHTIYDDHVYREYAAEAGADAFVSKSKTQVELIPNLLSIFSHINPRLTKIKTK